MKLEPQIFLLILLFLALPVDAKEIGDLHDDLNKAFPGKVHGLTQPTTKESAFVNDWAVGVTEKEKTAINNLIAAYDWTAKSAKELDVQIDQKLKDKTLTDEEFLKLSRAKVADKAEDKTAALEAVK